MTNKQKVYKVVLHPQEIVSKNDGDIHFIGGAKLAHLYGVLPTDIVSTYDHRVNYDLDNCIHLYPSYNGDYYDIHALDEVEPIRPTNKQWEKLFKIPKK